jgi:hypothetical protein
MKITGFQYTFMYHIYFTDDEHNFVWRGHSTPSTVPTRPARSPWGVIDFLHHKIGSDACCTSFRFDYIPHYKAKMWVCLSPTLFDLLYILALHWHALCYNVHLFGLFFSATNAIKENFFPEIFICTIRRLFLRPYGECCKGCASVEKRGEYYILWENCDVMEELLKVDPLKDLAQRACVSSYESY